MTSVLRAGRMPHSRVVVANQRVSIREQLRMGVRHLELDLHDRIYSLHPNAPPPSSSSSEEEEEQEQAAMMGLRWDDWAETEHIKLCHWDAVPPTLKSQLHFAHLRNASRHHDYPALLTPPLKWHPNRLGCWQGNLDLERGLMEIRDWLHDDLTGGPREFVTIYLDNRVRSFWKVLGTLLSVFPTTTLFTPALLAHRYHHRWPTQAQLVRDGFRVMVEYADKYGWRREFGAASEMLFERGEVWREIGVSRFRPFPECTLGGDPILPHIPSSSSSSSFSSSSSASASPLDSDQDQIVLQSHPNHHQEYRKWRVLDESLSLPFPFFNDKSPQDGITQSHLKQLMECGVEMTAMDQFVPDMLDAVVWSFDGSREVVEELERIMKRASHERDTGERCVKMVSRTGRWSFFDCPHSNHVTPMFKLCRKRPSRTQQQHQQDQKHQDRGDGEMEEEYEPVFEVAKECRGDVGWMFDVPRTPRENLMVREMVRARGIDSVQIKFGTRITKET